MSKFWGQLPSEAWRRWWLGPVFWGCCRNLLLFNRKKRNTTWNLIRFVSNELWLKAFLSSCKIRNGLARNSIQKNWERLLEVIWERDECCEKKQCLYCWSLTLSPNSTSILSRLLSPLIHSHTNSFIFFSINICFTPLKYFLFEYSCFIMCQFLLYSKVNQQYIHILLLLSHFSHVRLCATPWTAAYQASPSMGFSRQEHWSGLPFPSPVHESGKWKWIRSVVSDS